MSGLAVCVMPKKSFTTLEIAGTHEANMIKRENAAKTIIENIIIHRLTVGRFGFVSANGLDSLALLDMG